MKGKRGGSKDPGGGPGRLRAIVEGTAAQTGDAFFRSLVRHLARALGVKCALVAELKPEETDTVRTLAVWSDGFGENFEYPLAGTPCENVVNQTMCFYPSGIARLFPQDRLLVDMGAESYLGTPLSDSAGNALGLLAVLHDSEMAEDPEALDLLTIFASRAAGELERMRTEEALRRSEERTRRILETALDAVITIDSEGRVTAWSTRAEEIFGWRSVELLGQPLAELILPPPDRAAHREGLRRFLETGQGAFIGRRVETRALHRDGHTFPVELSIAAIQTDATYEFSAFVRDLTERKRAEEERRALEAQVQHAQRLESLGILAGGVAHDFGNLLTGILANAATARRRLPSGHPAGGELSEVTRGAKVASHLTEQLLAYVGKGEFNPQPLDLSAEVRELEPLLSSSVRGTARLVLDLGRELAAVEADPVQLYQVLMNLVLNAAESSDEEVCIRIVTREVLLDAGDLARLVPGGSPLRPGHCVVLAVEDTGPGMDAETRERVFEPFFTTKTEGSGLGLAVTLGIVHAQGGGIRLESRPGGGTTFDILFPRSREKVEADPPRSPRNPGSSVILVVDDDEYIRRGVCSVLEALGYEMIPAEGGAKAIELLSARDRRIDGVILDVTMPGMGGDEILRAVRAIRPDLKVLLSTAHPEEEARRRFPAEGVTGFLRKPYDPDELVTAVERWIGRGDPQGVPSQLDPELEVLRADYGRRLPDKLAKLGEALDAARAGSPAELERARDLAHQLRGTAGSYGFRHVARVLEVVDRALHSMLRGATPGTEEDWNAIAESMARARAADGIGGASRRKGGRP